MKLSDIAENYRSNANMPGGMFLLKAEHALQYIDDCVAAGFYLYGVDGFTIPRKGAVQPHQIHSNDIAETTFNQRQFVEETKQFISERIGMGLWFEVVFSENELADDTSD